MRVVVAAHCCCCLVFLDTFERPDGTAADGVNLPGGTRWTEFTSGDWSVSGGYLVCEATDSPIYFHHTASGGRIWSVEIDEVLLDASGAWAEVRAGDEVVRVTGGATGYTYSWGAKSHTINAGTMTYPAIVSLYVRFYRGEKHEYFRKFPAANVANDLIQFSEDECVVFDIEIPSGGYATYGLAASDGVKFDTVRVERTFKKCHELPVGCQFLCWPSMPATISVTLSGLQNGDVPCMDGGTQEACYSACDTAFGVCMGGGGTFCDCSKARDDCKILCMAAQSSGCVVWGPCEQMNTTVVLDYVGFPRCTHYQACPYVGEVEIERTIQRTGSCTSTETVTETITAEVWNQYYDEESDDTRAEIKVQILGAWYTTGVVDAADFCDGTALELSPATEGGGLYADEVSVADRPCKGNQFEFCSGGTSTTVNELSLVYCKSNADCTSVVAEEVLVCGEADHVEITVSDVAAS